MSDRPFPPVAGRCATNDFPSLLAQRDLLSVVMRKARDMFRFHFLFDGFADPISLVMNARVPPPIHPQTAPVISRNIRGLIFFSKNTFHPQCSIILQG